MWKVIGIPLVIYLVFVFYVYQPSPEEQQVIPIAKLIQQMPTDQVELYIQTNAVLAVQEMKRAKIPASITLAQAILESKYGTSELATKAHNHFGIKASQDDDSRYCLYSDEWSSHRKKMIATLSCFQKYSKDEESFSKHSDFLSQRAHYAPLFNLDILDYEAWANGLQTAGYATDPRYAQKLIAIIQRYQLFEYDSARNQQQVNS